MDSPLFSIITVTRNAVTTLPETLKSVLEQSFCDLEMIICDGLSNDGTVDLVIRTTENADKTIRFFSEKDNGIYDAMNKGIERARGKYLIFLNAGDAFHSDHTLALIADAIKEGSYPDIVYGQTIIVDSQRLYVADRHLKAPADLKFRDFSRGMLVCHQAFIVKRKIAPPYDLSYRLSADYKWCIECLKKSTSNLFLNEILIDYLYGGISDKHKKNSLKERFKIMSDYYGFLPTVINHIKFIPRFIKRKKLEGKITKEKSLHI